MNKLKGFLKSKWAYRLTDNQLLLFEAGLIAFSMGGILLLTGVVNPLFGLSTDVGGFNDVVASVIVCVGGLALLIISVIGFYKNREEIK